MIVDGNGSDLQTTSFLTGKDNKISYIDSYRARGIGVVYNVVTNWVLNLGNGGEGKTMGLSPFGEQYDPVIDFESKFYGTNNNYSHFMRRMPLSDILNHNGKDNLINPLCKKYRQRQKDEPVTDPYFSCTAFDVQAKTVVIQLELEKTVL